MKHYRHLAWPFYLTGLAFILLPAAEVVVAILPLSPSVLSWRVGAVGLLGRSVLTPLVGMVIVLGTAVLLEHVLVQRAVTVLAFAGAAAFLVLAGLFALDLLQFRGEVREAARRAFDASSVLALLKLLAATAILAAYGLSGRLLLRHARAHAAYHAAPSPLVGQHAESASAEP